MLKSFPKILTILFLTIFIFQLACLLFLTLMPNAGRAADIKFTPQVQGLDYTFNSSDKTTGNIANYVRAIYKYAIGIVGILAAVVLMIGGVMWIIAGGNATAIGEAKAWIGASLTGLILALLSYVILATINPALTVFQPSAITQVEELKTEGLESDAEIRNLLANNGIFANKNNCTTPGQTDCTSLANLPQKAINGVIKIKKESEASIIITGGTEAGHKEHGPNLPVLDLRLCPSNCINSFLNIQLLTYIHDELNLNFGQAIEINKRYTSKDGSFDVIREEDGDKSQHFHIKFN